MRTSTRYPAEVRERAVRMVFEREGGHDPEPRRPHDARQSFPSVRCPRAHPLDNGPGFVAEVTRERLTELGVTTRFIDPGSPWENGYIESYSSKLRDELLNGEFFLTLREAQILVEQ